MKDNNSNPTHAENFIGMEGDVFAAKALMGAVRQTWYRDDMTELTGDLLDKLDVILTEIVARYDTEPEEIKKAA